MTKTRTDIIQNPNASASLTDLPPEILEVVSTVASEKETTKIMAKLSNTSSHFYSFFKLALEKRTVAKALHYAAYARKEEVKALLDIVKINPELLLQRGNVITPGGLEVRGVTIYEFLLGAGDLELVEKVGHFFENIKSGKDERIQQYKKYKHSIENILTQEPDDLTWLFNVIKESSDEDVTAELAMGDQYDRSYQSPLRDALNKFRETKLDPKVRIMTEPRMHCNYQNFIHVYTMLDLEWNNLIRESNYDKISLIVRQVLGLIGLLELPGYERCLFAGNQIVNAKEGKEVERSYKYKYRIGSFPTFNNRQLLTRSGIGFDSYVSIFGVVDRFASVRQTTREIYKAYISKKLQIYKIYAEACINQNLEVDGNFRLDIGG